MGIGPLECREDIFGRDVTKRLAQLPSALLTQFGDVAVGKVMPHAGKRFERGHVRAGDDSEGRSDGESALEAAESAHTPRQGQGKCLLNERVDVGFDSRKASVSFEVPSWNPYSSTVRSARPGDVC